MQRALRTENPNPDAVHLGRTIPIPQGQLPSRHKTPQSQNQELEEKEKKRGARLVKSRNLSYFIIQHLIFR